MRRKHPNMILMAAMLNGLSIGYIDNVPTYLIGNPDNVTTIPNAKPQHELDAISAAAAKRERKAKVKGQRQ